MKEKEAGREIYFQKALHSHYYIVHCVTPAFYAFALIGDPTTSMLGTDATPEQVAARNRNWDLDRPVLVRYGEWLLLFLQGDMGVPQLSYEPWPPRFGPKLPITAVLTLMALKHGSRRLIPLGIARDAIQIMSVPPFLLEF